MAIKNATSRGEINPFLQINAIYTKRERGKGTYRKFKYNIEKKNSIKKSF